MVNFDQLLEESLKMVVSLIDFSDGVEKTIIGIMLTILSHEWKLDQSEVSNLASIYFIGIVGGTMFCAFNTDTIGRQRTLMLSSMIGFVCMLWMSLAQTYLEMFLLRLGFGFIFGTTIPLGHIVITEIIPANIRGSVMTFIASVFIVGKIYCTFLCMALLQGFDEGHWRILVALNSLPLLICCIGSVMYLRESPRYYLVKQQYQQAFEEIELIALQNNSTNFQLTNNMKEGLIENSQQIIRSETNFKQLFKGKYEGFTIRMWVVFILTSFIECSLYILMPFWLHQHNKGFEIILFMMISELFANMCIYKVIDSKIFGGRQKLVIYIALIIGVISLITYIQGEELLVFGMTTISFLKMMFTTEMVIMNENYTTQFRSMGVGLTQTVGKFTGAVIPFIIFPIFQINPFLPFLLYFICMLIQAIFAYQFPFDMTQVQLDCVKVFS